MTDNEIGVVGAKAVSEMLKANTTFKALDLTCEKEKRRKR